MAVGLDSHHPKMFKFTDTLVVISTIYKFLIIKFHAYTKKKHIDVLIGWEKTNYYKNEYYWFNSYFLSYLFIYIILFISDVSTFG